MSSMRGFQESDLIISTKCIFSDQFVKQTVSNKDSLQSTYKLKAEVRNAAQQPRSALWCVRSVNFLKNRNMCRTIDLAGKIHFRANNCITIVTGNKTFKKK